MFLLAHLQQFIVAAVAVTVITIANQCLPLSWRLFSLLFCSFFSFHLCWNDTLLLLLQCMYRRFDANSSFLLDSRTSLSLMGYVRSALLLLLLPSHSMFCMVMFFLCIYYFSCYFYTLFCALSIFAPSGEGFSLCATVAIVFNVYKLI